jgi:hypothetical protein
MEKPKRFKEGQLLTFLSIHDKRLLKPGRYHDGGTDQSGTGRQPLLRYNFFDVEANCWSISVQTLKNSSYSMLESEFEEYYTTETSEFTLLEPGDILEILRDGPSAANLCRGDLVTLIDLAFTVRDSMGKTWYLSSEGNQRDYKFHSRPKKQLDSSIPSVPKVTQSENSASGFRLDMEDVIEIITDHPWGSRLVRGEKAVVYSVDSSGAFVKGDESGVEAYLGNISYGESYIYIGRRSKVVSSSTSRAAVYTTDMKSGIQDTSTHSSSVKHTKPVIFRDDSESHSLVKLKHHKPIVIKGV